jgi:hypothetical protein
LNARRPRGKKQIHQSSAEEEMLVDQPFSLLLGLKGKD